MRQCVVEVFDGLLVTITLKMLSRRSDTLTMWSLRESVCRNCGRSVICNDASLNVMCTERGCFVDRPQTMKRLFFDSLIVIAAVCGVVDCGVE